MSPKPAMSAAPPIRVVAIGASAGGLKALAGVVEGLPAGFALALLVVQHVPPQHPSSLAQIFAGKCGLRVKEADEKEPVRPGTLYFAPPDYHLLVEDDQTLALSQEEPVNYSRPSIDVLFESAAAVWGPQLLGVLLSGASEDGAAGLEAIHLAGGLTVVQQPEEALVDTMPRAALSRFAPDYVLPAAQIQRLLRELESFNE